MSAVEGLDDLDSHPVGASHGGLEIGNLEPKQHSVPVGLLRITDGAMVVLDLPLVELENQPAADHETLVIRPAVGALTTEQALIPAAARFNVIGTDERLWMHVHSSGLKNLVCARLP